jgi:hypothetical protein
MAGQYTRYPVQGGGGGGTGDVVGPASSAQYQLAYYADTTGKLLAANASITASRALASDANGLPTASSVTATELGYLSGVTSAIQTQLNAKGAGTIVGSTGASANRILISNGTGGSTLQASGIEANTSGSVFVMYGAGNSYIQIGSDAAAGVVALTSGVGKPLQVRAGGTLSAGIPSYLELKAGDSGNVSMPAGDVDIKVGNNSAGGTSGVFNLYTALTLRMNIDAAGKITLGTTGSTQTHRINGATDATAGSIAEYLIVNINGTDRKIAVYAV